LINQRACATRLDFKRDDLIADAQGRRRAASVNRPDDRLAIHFLRLPAALTIAELPRPILVKERADIHAHQGYEQDAGDQFQFFRHHSIPTTRCQDIAAEKSRSMPSDSLAYLVCASGVPLRRAMFAKIITLSSPHYLFPALFWPGFFAEIFGGL